MRDQKKLTKIKSSVFSRGLSLAKLTVSTSTSLAAHGLNTLLSTDEEKSEKWKVFLASRAGELTEHMGKLKGSVMKAGQLLSMYGEHFLPKEANELLKNLQSQSPPVDWPQMEKILASQLSAEQRAELEIDPDSVGSASLGQVHRARIEQSNEWIALKIQYPDIDKAIDSDLKAIRSLLSLLKILPKSVRTDQLFNEVRTMLLQEIDYVQEAEATTRYRERLSGHPHFIVPKVYPDFSNAKILATSYEKGLGADDPAVQALSQERRNKIAFLFLELYFKELFEWGIVQTDAHLGNYKIRLNLDGDDQLVLLDFGAVRTYSKDFLLPYYRMIHAGLMQDQTALKAAARELKFIEPGDDPKLVQLFEEFCGLTIEPFLGQEFDWKNTDLPKRATKKAFEIMQKFSLRAPPEEILFLDRKTGGVFIFLSVLGAKINARELLLNAVNKGIARLEKS